MTHPAASRAVPVSAGLLAAALACTAVSGCGFRSGHRATAGPHASAAVSARPGDLTGGRHYRSGWFGKPENAASFDVHRVERYASYSVLYMDVYTGPGATSFVGWFGQNANSNDFGRFSLLDPTGKKYYQSLREGDADGPAFGTRIEDSRHPGIAASVSPQPGVRYPVEVYFPPIPAGVKTITVIAPGTLGEMTGIPVMDSGTAQAPVPKPNDNSYGQPTPKHGQTYFYPVHAPSGRIWSQASDLHDYVEAPNETTSTGGGEQKLALRTDVLFAFDKATLSPTATHVLDEAIKETRAEADPAKPPISIVGHTDSKGSPSYNMTLSLRRADAVKRYVAAHLGGAYQYKTSGKGETEPIAANTHADGSDNPGGRAKNRRVEIAYKIKQRKPAVTTTRRGAPATGAPAAPARFHPGDGPVVGSLNSPNPSEMFSTRLDVHPFYRDGAYLVGVFNLHNNAGVIQDLQVGLSDAETKAVGGATLGGLIATDPTSTTRYYVTRRGPFDSSGVAPFVEGTIGYLEHGQDNRLFAYYPAPPANVTKVDVSAGQWGTVHNVPVR